ncbi:hypothetical protein NL676_008470 [Syzygium grande]|nr:hypothetical protein NL676_008470 [Syzygium grande]
MGRLTDGPNDDGHRNKLAQCRGQGGILVSTPSSTTSGGNGPQPRMFRQGMLLMDTLMALTRWCLTS